MMTLACGASGGCAARIARDKDKRARVAQAPKTTAPTWTVEGWGKTLDSAEKLALKNAQVKINAYLQSLDPPLVWTPNVNYIFKNLWNDKEPRSLGLQKVVLEENQEEEVPGWSWTVSITPAQLEKMRQEDVDYRTELAAQQRENTAQIRMRRLAKLVGCVVLALAGVSLYLRLPKKTRRSTETKNEGVSRSRGPLSAIVFLVLFIVAMLSFAVAGAYFLTGM
jgi:hypothetical protein